MSLILIIIGLVLIGWSIRGIFSEDYYKKTEKSFPDSDIDRKLFSPRTRYIMGRYISNIKLLTAGIGMIILGIVLNYSS